ncbi:hypothetical protein D918_00308 [Trichuris suis]|nr:hypothetical protein D918_00308 [Trichuris suis]
MASMLLLFVVASLCAAGEAAYSIRTYSMNDVREFTGWTTYGTEQRYWQSVHVLSQPENWTLAKNHYDELVFF